MTQRTELEAQKYKEELRQLREQTLYDFIQTQITLAYTNPKLVEAEKRILSILREYLDEEALREFTHLDDRYISILVKAIYAGALRDSLKHFETFQILDNSQSIEQTLEDINTPFDIW